MSICALDKDTAKLITTTQIITSVSTAVKELIENALDADAKSIEINLIDNGTTLIEIKDDGCGISKADAPNMALPSYTSKIHNLSDLDTLNTYGFRGEALFALSAVSDLTVITKTKQDEVAVLYTIDHGGHIINSEPCHRSTGTTIQIRQLFKHIPVRRQIITTQRKANQDIKILEFLIKSYGMCKFLVRMSFKVDNNIIFMKPSVATLEEAVTYILGKKVTSNMTWINAENTEINMKVMVPSKGTQNTVEVFQSGAQYIFVNNRPIKHKELEKILTKTILEAIGEDSVSKKKPIFFLYLLTSAANIDVNLEPNKSSILFKEQQIVFNTVDKYIKDFYGIQREVQEENPCNVSLNDYQEYSQKISINNQENEWPACKKRKVCIEKSEEKCIQYESELQKSDGNSVNDLNPASDNNYECNKQAPMDKNGQNHEKKSGDRCEENLENLNSPFPVLDLSETDSNNSQNFTLVCDNSDNLMDSITDIANENTPDSPQFELTPHSETFSQLPMVDLGEDFDFRICLANDNIDKSEKENKVENTNPRVLQSKNDKSVTPKCATLKEWSKGHVSGLKGGTDIQPYKVDTEVNELSDIESYHGNVCKGFVKFSKKYRLQIIEQQPNMTAPQIALAVTDAWKKLSPEERGYYRDIAQAEEEEYIAKKQETKQKQTTDAKKPKNRVLKKLLEKMNTMNGQNSQNLLVRTIVPWNIDLKKVTDSFLNNLTYNNTNLVVGLLCPNLWVVHKSAHIWILDAIRLKNELNLSNRNENEDNIETIEQLLKQWFSVKDDLSILHPIH
ncbi:PMS1 protein homolog 1-like isoform X1 [Hylaeus volcanicus]|uniref:PMS1 protein homolog 1-like isoform X1 n=2 Tax=Hylaeus volcanicus TaxID=313075 RepID=UPI0023B83EA9|nr:PMS1 protein homolog 1-like isoform X1 [Hylaeus volcanicus]